MLTVEEGNWYNLRVDIAALSPTEMQFDFFVNGDRVRDPVVPPDSEILMDPSRVPVPSRRIVVQTIEPEGTCVGYVDNVRGVYMDHDLPPS